MERQGIKSAISVILVGVVCGTFGALGTYAIYDIVPSEYFTRSQRYLVGAFVSCAVISIIVLRTSMSLRCDKVQSE